MERLALRVEALHAKVDKLAAALGALRGAVTAVRDDAAACTASCAGMDRHIAFVEGVYETVRHPLAAVCGLVSGSTAPLPQLEDGAGR